MYTLVKHNGLPNGVMLHSIKSNQVDKVKKAGGLVFDSYSEADDAEYAFNYPSAEGGLYPTASKGGSFSTKTIDKNPIFVPTSTH